jgi:hypothetical protein
MKPYYKIDNMQLLIHGDRLISEVQQDFNSAYPFLKLEFFRNGLQKEKRYAASQKLGHNRKLSDSWIWKKDSGSVEVNESMTVLDLENVFMDEFGLSVQVFRKSGNIWLETTMTDHWTLKRQSDHGREISTGHKNGYFRYGEDFDMERDND